MRQIERLGPSPAKAEAALKEALLHVQMSAAKEIKRETRISDLGERFLIAKSGRSPRTVETYTRSVRKIIVPRIGDLAVSEATTERLQRFIELVAAENGPGEAKKARAVLSGMMGLATRSDALKTNPVRELAAIEGGGTGATAVPLSVLPNLLETVRADKQLAAQDMVDLIAFVAGTGVRISEALGLDWTDVELDTGAVTIRKSKTEAGERTIVVPAAVADVLRRRAVGPRHPVIVFPTPLGKRRDRHNTSGIWADARERLSLGPYTFHSFRKTVATALDQAGLTPRDIAEYLGHADPSLTMSVYMSKTVGGSRAANALDSVLSE
ncbi:tyrosine-type recombinase/integrase [Microbacterium imperiale]|uniref:tyrosine-type recombinase/integrase n=1 Tax=Microbacterium imperiale TaxID=33884 RepID=UPI001AE9DF4D|nr:site-specific integrase [Microbacterium imperiale]MBP2422080.1 integrase [Microbacterium imperiale]MDS0200239.1 site-specific integrase [Microbacterium imperiale]